MNNIYIPKLIRVERSARETPDTKTFFFDYPLDYVPGQFLEVSSFGAGEAPISISSSPKEKFLTITFRRAGCVTSALFDLRRNDVVGLRGPFGKGFPVGSLKGKTLLFIAGGIGLAPLRSLLKYVVAEGEAGRIILLYGARRPQDMLFKKEFGNWGKTAEVLLTVDQGDEAWSGRVGVVLELLNEVEVDLSQSIAFLCGPEIMMHFTVAKLLELGMNPADIVCSLERHMKCGVGKCGHCYIGDQFVCKDGPVFTCEQLRSLTPGEVL